MPHTRQISLNDSAGAFVDIFATIPCSYWEIMEDEANPMQGLQVKTPADGFTDTQTFSAGSEPVEYPNVHRYPQPPGGPLMGMPAMNNPGDYQYRAADRLLSVRSNGAATVLRITEYE